VTLSVHKQVLTRTLFEHHIIIGSVAVLCVIEGKTLKGIEPARRTSKLAERRKVSVLAKTAKGVYSRSVLLYNYNQDELSVFFHFD
jgi:hypothetical protein